MPCCPSAIMRSSRALSCTACCICSSSMRDCTLLPFTIPFIVLTALPAVCSVFSPLSFAFCLLSSVFLAGITYTQPLRHCFIVGAQSVGHADRKFRAPAHRSKDLTQFNVGSLKNLHHAFRNFIGIKPPVQLGVLRGYTTRTFSGIAEIAAVIFVAQAVGCRLHYVLAYGNHRRAEHNEGSCICRQVAFFAHASRCYQRQFILLALFHKVQITFANIGGNGVPHLVH